VDVHVAVDGWSNDVVVSFIEYRKVRDVELLISDSALREAQKEGKLLLIIVSPWDVELFNDIYVSKRSYEFIVSAISEGLQNAVNQGKIRRHLHIIILIPDLSESRMNSVLNKIVVYEETKKFLDYLSKKEIVLNERLREYEGVIVKRKDLLSILSEEAKIRHLRELRSRIEREIAEARSFAQVQLVRLSRDIAVDVLQLYRKVIYYSLDANQFSTKDIVIGEEAVKDVEKLADAINTSELKDYATIVNKFFVHVIKELAYEFNAMNIASALTKSYREEFEKGVLRERDSIDEVVENVLLGTYKVKPLSANVAHEAIVKYLDNQRLELADKDIVIVVNKSSRIIEFRVEPKKVVKEVKEVFVTRPVPVEIVPPKPTTFIPEYTIQHTSLELPSGFNVDDISQRLTALINMLKELGVEITSLKLKLDTESISLQMTLKKFTVETLAEPSVRAIMNLLSRMSKAENKAISMDIDLSKPVAEDSVRKVLGEYLKTRRSSFDKFLPT